MNCAVLYVLIAKDRLFPARLRPHDGLYLQVLLPVPAFSSSVQFHWCLHDLLPGILGNRNVVLQEASHSYRDSSSGIKSRRCYIPHHGIAVGGRGWIWLDHEDLCIPDPRTSCLRKSVHQVKNSPLSQACQAHGFHYAIDGAHVCFTYSCMAISPLAIQYIG
jgi:hypothetical protein